jgi:dolichol-phosphate mannosyltransferase
MKSGVKASVVIPVYNEEANLAELSRRLDPMLTKNDEVIFVNDGSKDMSLEILRSMSKKDPRVKILSFSRNFGQQAAITAGLEVASGDVVITMDADLQDPPELLPEFLQKISSGFDVVYGISETRSDPPLRKMLFNLYHFVMDKLSAYPVPRQAGIFAAMTREVAGVLREIQERNRFLPALRSWVGFRQVGISYQKPKRFAGRESQNLGKLFKMGFDSLFSFSYVPLRLATYLGLIVTFGATLGIIDVLLQKFVFGTAILGWAGPTLSVLVIGGTQLIILGIIGEYLGRIYDEVKRRPNYIVSEKIGF